ncbi:MAG TPA: DUF2950 domain-containing protein [Candidatus Angelobacter sp.]|nr:DUF2950 domain-containing protein [Candidatus Angelobacter sp.]
MKSNFSNKNVTKIALVLVGLCCLTTMIAFAQTTPTAPAKTAATSTSEAPAKPAAATAPAGAKAFDTPQAAADALIQASADYNVPDLLTILGPDGQDIVASADQVGDKKNAVEFAELAAKKKDVEISKTNPSRATLIVGDADWPLPIPLVKVNGKWYFNAKEGRQQILFRRIGANELDAITVCRGYVEAQKEYAATIHDDSGVNQYAQKVFSTPGKQDGLYWKDADGNSAGPIGDAVAKALEEGYSVGKNGFHGYYFKILKGQGPNAPNGAINYVIENVMIGGFALVAVPAEYRVTGVKTFIVSYEGTVYQKDLGPDSLEIVKKMELYNPDKTWQATNDEWPASVEQADQ